MVSAGTTGEVNECVPHVDRLERRIIVLYTGVSYPFTICCSLVDISAFRVLD